ncbi:MAG: twin-arginine translocase TatA/TatE family subunit [Acidimicrobiia bacterium]
MFGGRLSAPELIIILVVILLLFGARKLPDLARSLGASAKEFRKGIRDGSERDEEDEGEGRPTDHPAHGERTTEKPPGS